MDDSCFANNHMGSNIPEFMPRFSHEKVTVIPWNQFATIHEKMDGRFAALEDLMKKMLEDKQKPATSESKKAIGGHGGGRNPNPFRGRENPEVEVLEGDDGMPPLEPLSREEMSMGYDRRDDDDGMGGNN
ncbi:hypothetical protein M5K25_026184 [Dendrobium thyrsiflorum]|uniref:Uncharacterized protein n=1 Tax=Dendrobium thyrsiflorum TaxID=117978 RepID=A0ABD0TWQ0_DENTH